jgi:hypothetical protein
MKQKESYVSWPIYSKLFSRMTHVITVLATIMKSNVAKHKDENGEFKGVGQETDAS